MPMNQAQKMMLLYSSVGGIPGSPGQPTSLMATYDEPNTEIDISWTAPTFVGDSAIIDYQVQSKVDGGDFTDLEANSTDTASTLDNPMTALNVYVFRVRARNTQGVGAWSGETTLIVRGFTTADFSVGGITIEALALFTAGVMGQFLWALDSTRSADTGTLLPGGDVTLGTDTVINVVRRPNSAGVRLHSNVGSFNTWWNSLTAAQRSSLRLYLQLGETDAAIICTNTRTPGAGFIDFNVPSGNRAAWAAVTTGDDFIVAVGY